MSVVSPDVASGLADAVLGLHAGVAAFVVLGLVFIVVGGLSRWRSARSPVFRLIHLGAIGVIVAESWFGIVCPLTTLESALRARAGEGRYAGGFVEHWLNRLLFFEAPPWVFIGVYSLFASLVVASWWTFPPTAMGSRRRAGD